MIMLTVHRIHRVMSQCSSRVMGKGDIILWSEVAKIYRVIRTKLNELV